MGGEGKANCGRWQAVLKMAGQEMVRGSQKWGLEAERLNSTPQWSAVMICLLGSLSEMEGGWYRPRNKAKGSGESVCRFLLDTGDLVHCHQRRAREVSSRVVFNVHDLCADFRGAGSCWVS